MSNESYPSAERSGTLKDGLEDAEISSEASTPSAKDTPELNTRRAQRRGRDRLRKLHRNPEEFLAWRNPQVLASTRPFVEVTCRRESRLCNKSVGPEPSGL